MLRFIALFMLGLVPAIVLVVASVVKPDMTDKDTAGNELMLYVLLILALVQPLTGLLVERMQIASYRRSGRRSQRPAELAFSIAIIRVALVEAIYIYALVVYFLLGDFTKMLWFFPLGLIWTFVVWPREGWFRDVVERAERP